MTRFDYDGQGRLVRTTQPDGSSSQDELGSLSRVFSSSDVTGARTRHEYDVDGQRVSSTDAAGGRITTTYDALGQVVSTTDELGGVTRYGYDAEGRQVSETDPAGHVRRGRAGGGRRGPRRVPHPADVVAGRSAADAAGRLRAGAALRLRRCRTGGHAQAYTAIGPALYSFHFVAVPGHFDGAGSEIRFRFYRSVTGRLVLAVRAQIVNDFTPVGNFFNREGAVLKWQGFINNISKELICREQRHCR